MHKPYDENFNNLDLDIADRRQTFKKNGLNDEDYNMWLISQNPHDVDDYLQCDING